MGLLISVKDLQEKTKTCQMHGDEYKVNHPHSLIKYKVNNEKVKFLEMNRVSNGQEDVLMQLWNRSKKLLNHSTMFFQWDEF